MKKFWTSFCALALVEGLSAAILPVAPQCEYQTDPLSIDELQPSLSWQLESSDRGQSQSAYRIRVASSRDLLQAGKADLWDSGKILSSSQNHISYGGKRLSSLQTCFWTVGVWDQDQKFTELEQPAQWTMGLLQPEDWKATFIELPHEKIDESLPWVWYPGELFSPPGKCFFRYTLTLDELPQSAVATLSADNRFILYVNGQKVGEGNAYNKFFKFDIASLLQKGANQLAIQATNEGTQNNEAGLIGVFNFHQADGTESRCPINASWSASVKEFDGWEKAGFQEGEDWTKAAIRGLYGMKPWGKIALTSQPLPVFRKSFEVSKTIKRALLHICGLGQYELCLNGQKVGDSVIDPGWSNYRKSVLYSTYEMSQLLKPGQNSLQVLLGNGMYNVQGGRYIKFLGSFGTPKLICRLQIDYSDGTSQVIGTDSSWQVAPSPITFSCTYGGEDYDARLQEPAQWQAATPTEGPGGTLQAQYAPSIKIMQVFQPIQVTEPKPHLYVIDFGQNFSGLPTLTAQGQEGQTLRLWPGEILNEDGTVCQNQSGTPVYYQYTFGASQGEGEAITWSPRFTYYGSRYVQIEGADGLQFQAQQPDGTVKEFSFPAQGKTSPTLVTGIVGNFTYASAEKAGTFTCSNPLINQIDKLIRMAIYSNFQSVFTDCPHREKLGWLEQCHLMANGLIANLDLMRSYTKMMRDCSEAQLETGLVTDIAPEYTVFSPDFRDSPEWGSSFVLVPWYLWLQYGDTRLAERYYDSMMRYVHYLKSKKNKEGLVAHGLGDWYDVGPGPSGYAQLTAKEVTATGTYYQDLMAMIHFAKLFGKESDLQELTAEAAAVKALFNSRFYHEDKGYYDRNSQTANALPYVVGLVEDDQRANVMQNLVSVGVRGATNRITAGDVGFSYLVKALLDAQQGEVLFDMVTQTNGPGYAHMLAQGCTSLHESWKAEKSSSFNHFMLGHAEEWFYRGIGGISPDPQGPGYAQFILRPQVVGDLSSATVTYRSIRGAILSDWKVENGHFLYHIRIPANTVATVYLPTSNPDAKSVREGTQSLASHPQIQVLGAEEKALKLRIPSGEYTLSAEY